MARFLEKMARKIPFAAEVKFQLLKHKIGSARYVFVHSVTNNIGDLKSCPIEYFPLFSSVASCRVGSRYLLKAIEQFGETEILKLLKGRVVVLGGGGLIALDRHSSHDRVMQFLSIFARSGGTAVAWGIGHNRMGGWRDWMAERNGDFYPAWLADFALIGLRDLPNPYAWVPCVSCMHPAFEQRSDVKHEVVAFLHGQESARIRHAFHGIPQLDNIQSGNRKRSEQRFREVIELIGSGRTVVTNSYHGLYWATLLGKNVIAMPNSSKFSGFKYPFTVCEDLSKWRECAGNTSIYSGALAECREANKAFFERFRALV